ncbi:MAG: cadmium-translocating P-type ATPase [Oscillospiraceae bacterium]|nr:cadmium-translocating P-type ATPase [Oscillospiraceae bacterium]
MTKKQKQTLYRILLAALLLGAAIALEHLGMLDGLPWWGTLAAYLLPYGIIGWDVLWEAVEHIFHGQVFDENFLMAVASVAAFCVGEYPEAAAVMLLYQVGELFQSCAVGKSRKSIAAMMDIVPEYANLETPDGLSETDPDEVPVGSVIVVKPGERIPLDGVVLEGESLIDTAALTGESVPRRAVPGSELISGCVNGSGTLRVRTTKAYEDATVTRILELVENASSRKARVEGFITRFARYYTPIVTLCAVLLAVLPPLLLGKEWGEWIRRACIFLVVSCPCALVISVPLGFFGGIGAASRKGILVKGSNYLESLSKLSTLVFDKTGTLTKGEFKVSAVLPATGTEAELLELAAYGESYSNHPIAASVREAYGREPALGRVQTAREIAGQGVLAELEGQELLVGSARLLNERGVAFAPSKEAGTLVYVALGGVYRGVIVISDGLKDGAAEALRAVKAAGVDKTVMLSGDHRQAAEAVAKALGLDGVEAELLPQDKVNALEKLLATQPQGRTLGYVGDGLNDAPVLGRADVGLAMGSLGSDAAIEAADVVIMDDDLRKLPVAIRIACKTLRIVKQNIVFALSVKFLILILGALGLANMWLAVFGDVGVSVIAILNSMRTLRN